MEESRVAVCYQGKQVYLNIGESLLDAAIKNQLDIPYSCRSGLCQNCLVKITEGEIPAAAQQGLSEQQIRQGYALSCQLKPTHALTIQAIDAQQTYPATVLSVMQLSNNIVKIKLEASVPWYAGQYLTLWKDQQTGRPYSIASLPEENAIECHIKVHPHGTVSNWLAGALAAGSVLQVGSPLGNCFYTAGMAQCPLLLVGQGTGLAPLYGIVRDALSRQHLPDIYLYAGARNKDNLYLLEEFSQLTLEHPNFHFYPVIYGDGDKNKAVEQVVATINRHHPKLQDWCVFLCGAPELVKKLQKVCFLNGASLKNINADPFITRQAH